MFERLLKLMEQNMPDNDFSNATPESRLLEDLGIDSIGLMMLSMAIEDEFGVRFNEPVPFETVQDVLDYLDKHAKKK